MTPVTRRFLVGDGEGMGLGEDPGKWPGKAHTSRNRQKNQVITDHLCLIGYGVGI